MTSLPKGPIARCEKEGHVCFNCVLKEDSSRVWRLLEIINRIQWGEITISVKSGKMVLLKSLREDVKLDGEISGLR